MVYSQGVFPGMSMLHKRLVAVVFLLVVALGTRGAESRDFDYNTTCRNAYTAIMSLRFDEGTRLVALEKTTNPRNRIPLLLNNYIDFLSILINDNPDDYEERVGHFDDAIDKLESADIKSPFYLYALAETRMMKAFAKFKFEEYFGAALELYRAKALLDENTRKFPSFVLNMKWMGVIQCLSGTIPDNYRWLGEIVGYKGSIAQGEALLQGFLQAGETNSLAAMQRQEVQMMLSIMYLNLSNDRNAQTAWMNTLVTYCPGNPLISYCTSLLAIKTFNNDLAIKILKALLSNPDYKNFHFASYQLGIASLNKLDARAFYHFEHFLAGHKGHSYVKAAHQKLAWSMLVNGYAKDYVRFMYKLKNVGANNIEDDKLAQKEAETATAPNVMLLKARLLFDGGYFDIALQTMLNPSYSASLISRHDKIEFNYRIARIYQELNKIPEAITNYKATIEACKAEEFYFGPNSALQLGIIYEKSGNKTEAIRYYEMVPRLHTVEYRNSLNIKAKAYLNKLKHK